MLVFQLSNYTLAHTEGKYSSPAILETFQFSEMNRVAYFADGTILYFTFDIDEI